MPLQAQKKTRSIGSLMKKQTALVLLGGTVQAAADALGCACKTVRAWPDPLPQAAADRVLGARLRLEWHSRLKGKPRERSRLHEVVADALEI